MVTHGIRKDFLWNETLFGPDPLRLALFGPDPTGEEVGEFLRYEPIDVEAAPLVTLPEGGTAACLPEGWRGERCPLPGRWWKISRCHGWNGVPGERKYPLCDFHFAAERYEDPWRSGSALS